MASWSVNSWTVAASTAASGTRPTFQWKPPVSPYPVIGRPVPSGM